METSASSPLSSSDSTSSFAAAPWLVRLLCSLMIDCMDGSPSFVGGAWTSWRGKGHNYQSIKPGSCVVFKHGTSLQTVNPFSLAETGNTVKVIISWRSTGKTCKHSVCLVMERGPFPQKQNVSWPCYDPGVRYLPGWQWLRTWLHREFHHM